MNTLLFLLVIVVGCFIAARIARRAWDLERLSHVPVEAAARLVVRPVGPRALQRALARAVTRERIVMASGQTYAAARIVVRIAAGDEFRLHPQGDLDAIAADLAQLYAQHAAREGWVVEVETTVVVEIDHRLNQGWVPAVRSTAPADDSADLKTVKALSFETGPIGQTVALEPGATMPLLVVECSGRRYPVAGSMLGLGRKHNGQFAVEDPATSYKHAILAATPTGWTLTDLGSRNGTTVDGTRLTAGSPHPVGASSDIVLGSARLRLTLGGAG